jgi:hypothetical protein
MSKTAVMTEQTGDEGFARALERARAEFLEMPGLTLTTNQATRLFAFDHDLCEMVLTTLVESHFLVRTRNAAFVRSE